MNSINLPCLLAAAVVSAVLVIIGMYRVAEAEKLSAKRGWFSASLIMIIFMLTGTFLIGLDLNSGTPAGIDQVKDGAVYFVNNQYQLGGAGGFIVTTQRVTDWGFQIFLLKNKVPIPYFVKRGEVFEKLDPAETGTIKTLPGTPDPGPTPVKK